MNPSLKRLSRGRLVRVAGLAVLALALAGCGRSKKADVSGTISYRGAPVTGGTLTLYPVGGKRETAIPVFIKKSGAFVTTGVPPGDYEVAIETESVKKVAKGYDTKDMKPPSTVKMPEKMANPQQSGDVPVYVEIPRKYADPKTSGLKWTITKGKNEKPFELTD
jgi:hypothetical protein